MDESLKKSRKPLIWVGSTLRDLRAFPDPVQRLMGFVLAQAQEGGKHAQARPLKGFGGAGVLEIVEDCAGNAYRAVYTVKFEQAVYGLHAFQKKQNAESKHPKLKLKPSKIDSRSPRVIINKDLQRRIIPMSKRNVTLSSGNVFADLGLMDAEEYMARTKLALRIIEIIRERKLTQTRAAKILGVDQPKISALMHGRLDGFSTERLFRFLNDLGRDVEIIIRPRLEGNKKARVRVLAAREN